MEDYRMNYNDYLQMKYQLNTVEKNPKEIELLFNSPVAEKDCERNRKGFSYPKLKVIIGRFNEGFGFMNYSLLIENIHYSDKFEHWEANQILIPPNPFGIINSPCAWGPVKFKEGQFKDPHDAYKALTTQGIKKIGLILGIGQINPDDSDFEERVVEHKNKKREENIGKINEIGKEFGRIYEEKNPGSTKEEKIRFIHLSVFKETLPDQLTGEDMKRAFLKIKVEDYQKAIEYLKKYDEI